MATKTFQLREELSADFRAATRDGSPDSVRAAVRRQVWTRHVKRVAATTAVCGLAAAATLAGAAIPPADGGEAKSGPWDGEITDGEDVVWLVDDTASGQYVARRSSRTPSVSDQPLYAYGMTAPPEGLTLVREGDEYVPTGRARLTTADPPGPRYPDEVRKIVEELDAQEAHARKEVERLVRDEKRASLERLRGLQDRYTREGRLDDAVAVRDLVRKLEAELLDVQPDPGWLSGYRGRVGATFVFRVTGNPAAGTIWGSGVYTDDSPLAAVVVHAGVLGAGETGLVEVSILPGQARYGSSSRNGVTTNSYADWRGSYRVRKVDAATSPAGLPGRNVLDPSGRLDGSLRGKVGESFVIPVTGKENVGPVWGSDVYTDDSAVAAAAVHAGVLNSGETGLLKVTILPGQDHYAASERNGVSSLDYNAWGGSFRLERAGHRPARGRTAADPGDLTAFASRSGTHLFRVTGSTDGYVWGTDLYTSDSDLSTAAVHAGVLGVGETGIVKVTVVDGLSSYPGSTRNGVTSRDWRRWGASYKVERTAPPSSGPAAAKDETAESGQITRLLEPGGGEEAIGPPPSETDTPIVPVPPDPPPGERLPFETAPK